MNKTELISSMAEICGLKRADAEKALDAFLKVVGDELAEGGDVKLIGFGTFSVSKRASMEGRNPKTGSPISIPARIVPKFKPGKQLKDLCTK